MTRRASLPISAGQGLLLVLLVASAGKMLMMSRDVFNLLAIQFIIVSPVGLLGAFMSLGVNFLPGRLLLSAAQIGYIRSNPLIRCHHPA
ncbi:hypothetical protein KY389_12545 [Paracoccus bogoriensis]|uniref:hypothetical protein n=1 Tax=Paracoccus bogoriensis TaxID=242065 RepID=UPI001CA5CE09|nr:hypothetical protein [Paracoccus bogoriensis]MBW7057513.1 hypothetical protein [Paracoccus bogoriensis]